MWGQPPSAVHPCIPVASEVALDRVVSEPRKPAVSTTTDEVRAEITALVQKNLPALNKTYFEATQEKKKNP